jgi:hypothetical protein
MSSPIQKLLQSMASNFQNGDIDKVAACFAEPLAIFADGEVVLEATASYVPELIFRMRAEAVSRGMARVKIQIRELDDDVNGRRPVVVDWVFLSASGTEVGRSSVRYYCAPQADGMLRIEMVEYLEIAFPNFLRTLTPSTTPN